MYAEEFEDQYSTPATSTAEKNVLKQMSISDDAQHHDDHMQNKSSLDDEYLDEFDEDRTLRKLSSVSGGAGGGVKKQESIMEDDPELKHLEEQQNLKNQQLQQIHHDEQLDEMQLKAKKSVTISEDVPIIHEKPRETRTAKQRWHWAYNRIVHQQQVSGFNLLF